MMIRRGTRVLLESIAHALAYEREEQRTLVSARERMLLRHARALRQKLRGELMGEIGRYSARLDALERGPR